jgi:hypothetical protein
MKEAMWRVDPVRGIGYRDPRDPNQETLALELEPDTGPLRRLLLQYLNDQPGRQAQVEILRQFTLLDTIYKPTQTILALRRLIKDGLVRQLGAGRLITASIVQSTGVAPFR